MHKKYIYISSVMLLTSCGIAKKKTTYGTPKSNTVTVTATNKKTISSPEVAVANSENRTYLGGKAEDIINSALKFSGTRYKFGGTTNQGMDCSGLLYVAFGNNDILLPRISHEMAEEGKEIRLKDVSKGDLVFFKTTRKTKRINHVGLVVAIEGDDIKFIHSSSSRGVIVSSLKEGFWNEAFVKATRIL